MTVDMSRTYTEWAKRNLALNGLATPPHGFVQADVLTWLEDQQSQARRYDLMFIDPPTLRDVWASAPYLHDGSAATLADAVRAHTSISLSPTDVNAVSACLAQIGSEETSAPAPAP